MTFKNPTNNYMETYGAMSHFWALMFGWIYCAVQGLRGAAIVMFCVWLFPIALNAIFSMGLQSEIPFVSEHGPILRSFGDIIILISHIILACRLKEILKRKYLSQGWEIIDAPAENESLNKGKFPMTFKNPANNYTETYKKISHFWAFLFGWIYCAVQGLWGAAIVMFCIWFIQVPFNVLFLSELFAGILSDLVPWHGFIKKIPLLASIIFMIPSVILSYRLKGILKRKYLSQGWEVIDGHATDRS